ncbi:MAG: arginine-tRNA-protein transferase [Pyrinomonadaceae bacterium]
MSDQGFQFINEVFETDYVNSEQIDLLLADGWRRFGTRFHRYNLNIYQEEIVRVIPLRVRLADFRFSKSQRRVLRRNADLRFDLVPADLTQEIHELFEAHKQRFSSDTPPSIYTFLSGEDGVPCPTHELTVRDGDARLLAASFMDTGAISVSSIYAIFDPVETKRGLGILTMLKEIEWAIENGKQYYYPGYVYDIDSFYDYKKRFSALERFDWVRSWIKSED